MDIGLGEVEEPEQQLYDCCICSQHTASTNERLIGLVALLQPSNGVLRLTHILQHYYVSVCGLVNVAYWGSGMSAGYTASPVVLLLMQAVDALTLLVGRQEGHLFCKKWVLVC